MLYENRNHKWVYLFNEGNSSMKMLLGGKGANVAEMTNADLPVPPGFTITTEACNSYYDYDRQFPEGMWTQSQTALKEVETKTGKIFGDPKKPLLVSVRSGAAISMPGMMDTVLNLGLNACDAMPQGGKLTFSTHLREIEVTQVGNRSSLRTGRYAEIEVSDTGNGMDEATKERIFEPFYTTKAPGEGVGLGLAISSGIISDLGGRLTARNGQNSGAVFEINLPLYSEDVEAAE